MTKNKSSKGSDNNKTVSSKKKVSSKKTSLSSDIGEETPLHYKRRWCAALSYLIVGLIWYFFDDQMKKDSFVKYHVKQGLVLLISVIILQVLLTLMAFLMLIWLLLGLFLFVIGLIGVVYALEHKEKSMPLIGKYAKNFTF